MLYAVTGEHLVAPVVAAEGNRDDHGTLGKAQALCDHLRDICVRQRLVELCAGHQEERRVPFEGLFERRCLQVGHCRPSLGSGLVEGALQPVAHTSDTGGQRRLAEHARNELVCVSRQRVAFGRKCRARENQRTPCA